VIELMYVALTRTPAPDVESMGARDAHAFARARWDEWMEMPQQTMVQEAEVGPVI
jgi:hypothetical protein